MLILSQLAYPTPAVVSSVHESEYEGSVNGLTKLELFTLHAMAALIPLPARVGNTVFENHQHIAEMALSIARKTLLHLEETEPYI